MFQQVAAFVLVAAALAYILWRIRQRRLSANCCGKPECPAAKQTVDRLLHGEPPSSLGRRK